MVWTVIWLMLLLIPIGGLYWIVWWAIHKTDEQPAVSGDDDGGSKIRVHSNPYPRAPRPRSRAGCVAVRIRALHRRHHSARDASSREPARSSTETMPWLRSRTSQLCRPTRGVLGPGAQHCRRLHRARNALRRLRWLMLAVFGQSLMAQRAG
jgi:hypothetical protein